MVDLTVMFPATPSLRAEWAPIYIEPLEGSGERFVVAVACRGESGGAAKLAIRHAVLRCMYAEQGLQVLGLAELIVESLNDHLSAGGSIADWMTPATSCHVGPIRLAFGDSLESILNQGIRLTASLAEQAEVDPQAAEDAGESSAIQVDRFIQQVKATVRQRVQEFETRFKRTISVRFGAAPTEIGYLGERLAANFDILVPGVALSRKRTRAKAKLLDLQALKDQVDLIGNRNAYELMLWVPPANAPMYSDADMKRSEEVFVELQEIGDKHELRVEKMSSAEQAAARIFSAEGLSAA